MKLACLSLMVLLAHLLVLSLLRSPSEEVEQGKPPEWLLQALEAQDPAVRTLDRTASIAGTAIAADGLEAECQVLVYRRSDCVRQANEVLGWIRGQAIPASQPLDPLVTRSVAGQFKFDGLENGSYVMVASSDQGRTLAKRDSLLVGDGVGAWAKNLYLFSDREQRLQLSAVVQETATRYIPVYRSWWPNELWIPIEGPELAIQARLPDGYPQCILFADSRRLVGAACMDPEGEWRFLEQSFLEQASSPERMVPPATAYFAMADCVAAGLQGSLLRPGHPAPPSEEASAVIELATGRPFALVQGVQCDLSLGSIFLQDSEVAPQWSLPLVTGVELNSRTRWYECNEYGYAVIKAPPGLQLFRTEVGFGEFGSWRAAWGQKGLLTNSSTLREQLTGGDLERVLAETPWSQEQTEDSESAGQLSVILFDPDAGRPIGGLDVTAIEIRTAGRPHVVQASTDDHGFASLSSLFRGRRYVVRARANTDEVLDDTEVRSVGALWTPVTRPNDDGRSEFLLSPLRTAPIAIVLPEDSDSRQLQVADPDSGFVIRSFDIPVDATEVVLGDLPHGSLSLSLLDESYAPRFRTILNVQENRNETRVDLAWERL